VPADNPHERGARAGVDVMLMGVAASGVLGASGAVVVAILHNLGTVAVMANAGRLLRFQEE
jgi:Zn2+/Cd2+-exporting ATPase